MKYLCIDCGSKQRHVRMVTKTGVWFDSDGLVAFKTWENWLKDISDRPVDMQTVQD